jgi:hypothetical protein
MGAFTQFGLMPETGHSKFTQRALSCEKEAEFFPDERMSFPARMLIVTGDRPNQNKRNEILPISSLDFVLVCADKFQLRFVGRN